MDKQLEMMQQAYNDIEIPQELSAAARKGIERGKQHRRKNSVVRRSLKWGGSAAAAVLVSFTISVNTMPAFAGSLEQVPVLGKLVKVLQFTQGSAGGGTIQDGVDVDFIALKTQGERDQLILNFANPDEDQTLASSYNVKFTEYPYTMTISVSGARKFSAAKDLETLKESRFVEDAYPLITLDDSAIRFSVTFKEPVAYEVKEYKDPAQVVITLKQGAGDQKQPVYSLRTPSQPAGETLAIAEEMLFGVEGLRMLKDQKGLFLVEAGYYPTEEAAQEAMKQIQTEHGYAEPLIVEKRMAGELPQMISADQ
ncbi:DUF4179 domain-containing protein [Paenibacillus agri]|uniref:DUF4179 domain-containing protein n=1 Tax=Paenibacillus agri TaxID=2744309 RepID=A0A850EU41_9BACL|nr:DUF4179 domain-containing protein [Paenibacillus agri]NUU62874.1 DUF4179 domain-containing protein [Paenibacillus agri]